MRALRSPAATAASTSPARAACMPQRSATRCSSSCQPTSLARAALAAWYASRQQDTKKSAAQGPGKAKGWGAQFRQLPPHQDGAWASRTQAAAQGSSHGGWGRAGRQLRGALQRPCIPSASHLAACGCHGASSTTPRPVGVHRPAQNVASEQRAVLATRGTREYQGSRALRTTDCRRSARTSRPCVCVCGWGVMLWGTPWGCVGAAATACTAGRARQPGCASHACKQGRHAQVPDGRHTGEAGPNRAALTAGHRGRGSPLPGPVRAPPTPPWRRRTFDQLLREGGLQVLHRRRIKRAPGALHHSQSTPLTRNRSATGWALAQPWPGDCPLEAAWLPSASWGQHPSLPVSRPEQLAGR